MAEVNKSRLKQFFFRLGMHYKLNELKKLTTNL